MKTKRKEHAIALRRQGQSYAEIAQTVPVSKATLSLWLRDIKLTKKQQIRLAQLIHSGQQQGAQIRRKQRLDRLVLLEKEVEKEIPTLVQSSFFLFGLALYWAEGTKQKPWNLGERVMFANSDERSILLMRKWFLEFCNIDAADLSYRLHIHASTNIETAKHEWLRILGIDEDQISVTLKYNNSKFRRNKNTGYKGLVSISVSQSTWLNRRIALWVDQVAMHYSDKL